MNIPDIIKKHEANFQKILNSDIKAKAENTLVGRYISHPFADGSAYYRIIKEGKSTVKIKVCTGIGDDWVLPAWGEICTISKKLALEFIRYREGLDAIFNTLE
jgi:hypothetical protein